MSGWDFDDSEEWDAAPAVVKKKVKKKTEIARSGEWDSARDQEDATALSKPSLTPTATGPSSDHGHAASASRPQQREHVEPPAGPASVEPVDLEALQQKVSELDAQLEVEEQERLIRAALLTATDNSTTFDLKEMHGNVRTLLPILCWLSLFPLAGACLVGLLPAPIAITRVMNCELDLQLTVLGHLFFVCPLFARQISLQTLFILGRREESTQAFADCVTCFEVNLPDSQCIMQCMQRDVSCCLQNFLNLVGHGTGSSRREDR